MGLSQKEIQKMALNKITLPREVGEWLDQWFRDILERNHVKGDIYEMLREAYVLGTHHALLGMEHLQKQGKTPYDGQAENTPIPA